MIAAITLKGGVVRFDEFAREHLLSPHGFYSSFVDLRSAEGKSLVPTPSGLDHTYQERLGKQVASMLSRIAEQTRDRVLHVAELGPGAGTLRQSIIKHAASWLKSEGKELHYTSIDPNPWHLSAAPAQAIDHVHEHFVQGIAEQLPLPGKSVHLLLDEEVLDSLPFRVFRFDKSTKLLTHEARVMVRDGALYVHWGPIDRDTPLQIFEEHSRFLGSPTPLTAFAPNSALYWQESGRVLHPSGCRISIDYGEAYVDLGEHINPENPRGALKRPYHVDITHGIVFSHQMRLARELGGFSHVTLYDVEQFQALKETFASPSRGMIVASRVPLSVR
jgi:SAM-dependent MidA family methyltransferase